MSQVPKMATFNKTKGATEVQLGHIEVISAGKILEISRTYGKGRCTNLVVFDALKKLDTNEIMEYKEKKNTGCYVKGRKSLEPYKLLRAPFRCCLQIVHPILLQLLKTGARGRGGAGARGTRLSPREATLPTLRGLT